MCGIAGIAGRRDEETVRRMTDALAHRGPDDAGFYADDGVTLGHRRLSIIDLAGGHQPMAGMNGALQLVYNGEIYNFRELRTELEGKGFAFVTNCDTEVILRAYEAYGESCVERFRGMFAFALWDARDRKLFVARDAIGVKPVYYAEWDGCLYFASEIKGLLACPGMPRELDPEGLDDFFTYLYTVPPRTMFRGLRQLPPAHVGVWRNGVWNTRRYWQLRFVPEERPESEWIEAINACLEDTVEKHLISDVPLGAFLSGGLDSSTIVHYMSRVAAGPVNTFTIGFGREGALYDESAEARGLARHYGTQHRELTAEADVLQVLSAMVRHFDEPFGNPSAVLFYVLCRLIREHVTVVLSGDGGDESFAGYPRHAGAGLSEWYRLLPDTLRRHIINPLVQLLPESTRGFHALRRLREFSAGSLLNPVEMYAAWITYFSPAERAQLYTPELRRDVEGRDALDYVRGLFRECEGIDLVSQALYVDIVSFLPHNLLQCTDRMSMAHGLESRVPFADQRLIELLARIPGRLKVRGTQTKRLLRRSMDGRLPEDTLCRKKRGFNPPLGIWLKDRLRPLADEYLSADSLRQGGYFQPELVATLRREHASGRRDCTWHLWALLLFEEWRRQYLD